MSLIFQEFEMVWLDLADVLSTVPPEKSSLFLAKLVLLMAHRLPTHSEMMALIQIARDGIDDAHTRDIAPSVVSP